MAHNARDILTGASMLVFCGAVSLYFPIFGFMCFLLLPLPVIFYRVKLGGGASTAMTILALVVIWALGADRTVDIWLMLCMLGLGLALGDVLERNLSVEKTIAYPCGMVLAGGLAALVLLGGASGAGPLELTSAYVRKNLEMTAAAYKTMDMPERSVALLTNSLDRVHYVIMRILPALTASGLVIAAWMNLLLARLALRAGGLRQPAFGHLNRWQAPEMLVWVVIGCGVLVLIAGEPLSFVGINGLILLMTVYFFQGIAVVSFYLEKKQVPMFLRILVYAFIALQQLFALVIIGVGFFDTWADFRRLGADGGDTAGPAA